MYHVKARMTTVTIGTRVFNPDLVTSFPELPPEVAEYGDLLHIEEVPDEQPTVEPGGLAATGTLQAPQDGGQASGPETGAGSPEEAQDGQSLGEGADGAGGAGTGAEGAEDGQGPATDPTLLTDEALTNGVALITVGDGDGDEDGPGSEPDPFADTAETLPPATPAQGTAQNPAPAGRGGGGKGGAKGARK